MKTGSRPVSNRPNPTAKARGGLPSGRRRTHRVQANDEKFFALAESNPAIIFIHQDGLFRYLNPAAETVLGYGRAELLRMHFWEMIHPAFRDLVRERGLKRQQGEPVPTPYEFPVVRPDGQERWLLCSAARIEFEGRPAVSGSAFDITEQKQAEAALCANEERFRQFVENIREVFWMTNLEKTRMIYISPGYEAIWGRSCASLYASPRDWLEAIHLDDRERVLRAALTKQVSGEFHEVYRILRPDGSIRWIADRAFPIRNAAGEVYRVAGIAEDITEYKRTEEALRQVEAKYRSIFENAVEGVFQTAPEGRFLAANPALAHMLGYQSPEELMSSVTDLGQQHYLDPPVRQQAVRLLEERGFIRGFEARLRRKDGRVIWVSINARVVRDDQGRVLYYEGTNEEITARKQAETRNAAFSALAHRLSVATSRQEAAKIIVHSASDLLGWDACYLHLCSPEGQIVPVLTMDTVNGQRIDIPPTSFTLDPSPMMRRITKEGAQLINREGASDATEGLVPFGDTNRRSASMMYVPIRSGATVIGVLSIQSYTPQAYGPPDLATLQALADHCGGALARINLTESLQQSEAQIRAMLEALPDFIFRIRKDGIIADLKVPGMAYPAYGSSGLRGRSLFEQIPSRFVEQARHCLALALQTGQPQTIELQAAFPDEIHDLEARIVKSGPEEGLAIVRDVTARRRLEKEVQEISARERRRIGHDLHDGLGQYLAGIALKAKILEENLALDSSPHSQAAGELVHLINNATGQTRSLASGLDPIAVEAHGLAPALQKLASETERLFGVSCRFQSDPAELPLSPAPGLHLWRIAQEAITNAVKHGQAKCIEVQLTRDETHLCLRIRDDGQGFCPPAKPESGMGLRIMEYRAHAIGGALKIESQPNGGTQVQCLVPLSLSGNPEGRPQVRVGEESERA